MNLLKLLGLQKKTKEKPYPYKDVLHLWEDDYLMIELLPSENLDFLSNETKRIGEFGEEHFDGTGFTDITPISEKPFKTIKKSIAISDVENIMIQAGLKRVSKFHMQNVGLLEGNKAPIGFGTNTFAIMCNEKDNKLEDIWIVGHTKIEADKLKLLDALRSFGQAYSFIGVDWFKCEYYNLLEEQRLEDFVQSLYY